MALSATDSKNHARILKYKRRACFTPNDTIAESMEPGIYMDRHGELAKRRIAQAQKRLSESEIENIVEEYQDGDSVYTLADRYGCNRKTISQCLKKHGVVVSIEKITSEQSIRELIALYESGDTIKEIAEHFGVGDTTIRRALLNNDVKMRTRWDY